MKFLRRKDVEKKIGMSRAWVYMMIAKGEFPKGTKCGPKSVVWVESEIDSWMSARVSATPAA